MQEKKYGIGKWSEDDQPREKLHSKSPKALSNAELLAILLNKGTHDKSAVDLARDVLNFTENDLAQLSRRSKEELKRVKGIGDAKAAAILACFELSRRRQATLPKKLSPVNGSREVVDYLCTHLGYLTQEVFGVIYLNHGNIPKCYQLHQGGITSTTVDIRVVMKKALETDTVKMILFHNHPSGNLQPSAADKSITSRISEAAQLLDMEVLDHLIISDQGHFSFADEGLL